MGKMRFTPRAAVATFALALSAIFVGDARATPPSLAIAHRSGESAAEILEFWTKERMAKARPLPVPRAADRPAIPWRPPGRPSAIEVQDRGALGSGTFGNGWWNPAWGVWAMVGRLYAVVEGGLATCSGTAVVSANRSTIWTAGHCTKGKVWYRKQLFVPGQNSKNGFQHPPYGKWPIADLYAPSTWAKNSACAKTPPYKCPWGSDYSALVAYRNRNGATLTSKVGALNIWFGSGLQSQTVLSLGYAASPPYFDKYAGFLFYCQNPVSSYLADGFGGYEWRLPCNMTAGASGGPWLRSYGGAWYLVANNSSSDTSPTSFPTTMFAPYLDPVNARGFYNYVQRRPPVGCVVPGLKGKRLARAKRAITRAHCSVGRVRRSYSRRVQKGRVKAQKPPRGKRYATGTRIDLVVSKGRRR